MASFENLPQEVVPSNASSEQVEREMWEHRMPALKRALQELRQDGRKQFFTLSDLANDRLAKMNKQEV
ncbi:hypothetical protein HN958_02625 [Candidatus Falkowbacteria bacterium]|jgi:hypothetical protein|nr:hypothetical protein [Candidatus Falkowbacteria bacterium]MBT7007377.1 hypothetical protein [Candidatus Falkowbacteria bacterium]